MGGRTQSGSTGRGPRQAPRADQADTRGRPRQSRRRRHTSACPGARRRVRRRGPAPRAARRGHQERPSAARAQRQPRVAGPRPRARPRSRPRPGFRRRWESPRRLPPTLRHPIPPLPKGRRQQTVSCGAPCPDPGRGSIPYWYRGSWPSRSWGGTSWPPSGGLPRADARPGRVSNVIWHSAVPDRRGRDVRPDSGPPGRLRGAKERSDQKRAPRARKRPVDLCVPSPTRRGAGPPPVGSPRPGPCEVPAPHAPGGAAGRDQQGRRGDRSRLREPGAARRPLERRQLISLSWYVPPKIAAPHPGLHVEALVLEAALELASASATFAAKSRSR